MTGRQLPEQSLVAVRLERRTGAEWRALFDDAADQVRGALGRHLAAIEHVGSTSIDGIAAKPIVDLAVAIVSFTDQQACIAALESLEYEYVPEFEELLPNRRYFRKGDDPDGLAFHIHVYERGHHEFTDHVLFRDHMRAHPDEAHRYESLKQDLAARLGRRDYTMAKAPYIQQILERARAALA